MLSVMCGRSTYKLTWEEIVALYRLTLGQPARNTQALQRLSDHNYRHDRPPERRTSASADAMGSRSVLVVEAAQRIEAGDV
jgi:hypothetical protein